MVGGHAMKRFLITVAAAIAFAACQKELVTPAPVASYTAAIEICSDTRTFTDASLHVKWSEGDCVSLWDHRQSADRYKISDAAVGSDCGPLELASAGTAGGGELAANAAYYPYAEGLTCSSDFVIEGITLPAVQEYAVGSFGTGAFPMVAVSKSADDRNLNFRNVCGVLRLALKGTETVHTIAVTGHAGEVLCGGAMVKAGIAEAPVITMTGDGRTVTLDCGAEGVCLKADEATTFDIVLPPVTFAQGFTVSVDGGKMELSTDNPQTISRSGILRMGEREVVNRESIKILAIGNSFSVDAMEYLWPLLKDAGYKNVTLGDLYIGGCSLQTHASHLTSGAAAYTYYTNTSGQWSNVSGYNALDALASQEWDYISVQQVSGYSGIADSYEPYLSTVLDIVKARCPDAKIMWHMTWAYQGTSSHADFAKYGNDQMTMYKGIVDAVKTKVLTRDDISFVIPSGTAVQNLRTSVIGDTFTRDGYHMSYEIGRLLTAMMWARQISGVETSKMTSYPSQYKYSAETIAALKDAVEKAYQSPLEVTKSSYTPPTAGVGNEELRKIFTDAGYKLEDYKELEFPYTPYAFWNSTAGSVMTTRSNSTASNLDQFTATPMMTRADLPNGTVIVLKTGYQYRPEGWVSLSQKNSSATRPGNVTTQIVTVNDAWWGSFTVRAFNLAFKGNPGLSEAQMATLPQSIAFFVPKQHTVDEYDLTKYDKVELSITNNAYYQSTTGTPSMLVCAANGSTAKNLVQFAATQIFSRLELPDGTLIVVNPGYQYRPEGWVSLSTANASADRPVNVTTPCVVVDAAWWGKFNYRAFNIAKAGNPDLSAAEQAKLGDNFAIYVPKQ